MYLADYHVHSAWSPDGKHTIEELAAAINVPAENLKKTIEAVKNDEQRINDLERIVNLQHNNIMERLRKGCTKLTERELKVILYSYAGFSARAITIFMDSDLAALSRLKYKIKTKLHEVQFHNSQEVLNNILGR